MPTNKTIDYTTPFWQDTADLAQLTLGGITLVESIWVRGGRSAEDAMKTISELVVAFGIGLAEIEQKHGQLF